MSVLVSLAPQGGLKEDAGKFTCLYFFCETLPQMPRKIPKASLWGREEPADTLKDAQLVAPFIAF